ncbi:kinesin-like protein kif13a [Aphanomyces cochlioides]|nr:kinesin-like protein kif13a [Aphanomyces cochlioides]
MLATPTTVQTRTSLGKASIPGMLALHVHRIQGLVLGKAVPPSMLALHGVRCKFQAGVKDADTAAAATTTTAKSTDVNGGNQIVWQEGAGYIVLPLHGQRVSRDVTVDVLCGNVIIASTRLGNRQLLEEQQQQGKKTTWVALHPHGQLELSILHAVMDEDLDEDGGRNQEADLTLNFSKLKTENDEEDEDDGEPSPEKPSKPRVSVKQEVELPATNNTICDSSALEHLDHLVDPNIKVQQEQEQQLQQQSSSWNDLYRFGIAAKTPATTPATTTATADGKQAQFDDQDEVLSTGSSHILEFTRRIVAMERLQAETNLPASDLNLFPWTKPRLAPSSTPSAASVATSMKLNKPPQPMQVNTMAASNNQGLLRERRKSLPLQSLGGNVVGAVDSLRRTRSASVRGFQDLMEQTRQQAASPRLELGRSILVAGTTTGIVRYIGAVHFDRGLWIGIALTLPHGQHNGTVDGVSYFTCEERHGVFMRANRLDP